MGHNIPEILQTRKAGDVVLALSIMLLGALSFGLGRLSATDTVKPPVALCTSHGTVLEVGAETGGTFEEFTPSLGKYVASKNGSVYHFPWCSGAKRINDENKVWFTTKEEAEQAGYRPASNCKGL